MFKNCPFSPNFFTNFVQKAPSLINFVPELPPLTKFLDKLLSESALCNKICSRMPPFNKIALKPQSESALFGKIWIFYQFLFRKHLFLTKFLREHWKDISLHANSLQIIIHLLSIINTNNFQATKKSFVRPTTSI